MTHYHYDHFTHTIHLLSCVYGRAAPPSPLRDVWRRPGRCCVCLYIVTQGRQASTLLTPGPHIQQHSYTISYMCHGYGHFMSGTGNVILQWHVFFIGELLVEDIHLQAPAWGGPCCRGQRMRVGRVGRIAFLVQPSRWLRSCGLPQARFVEDRRRTLIRT